jgi:Putative sensor
VRDTALLTGLGLRPGRGPRPGLAPAMVRAPFLRRTYRDLLFCLISVPLGVIGFVLTVALLVPGGVITASVIGFLLGLVLITLALGLARQAARLHRQLAHWLLGERVAALPAFRPGHGILGRLDARLRDGTG